MILSENFRIAFSALRANKMRSILTALGIIIGVAAVVAVVSIVQGLQFMITKELQGVGATYIMVLPSQDQNQGPGIAARQVRLTWEDGQAITQQVRGVAMLTPLIGGRSQLKYLDRQHDPDFIFGVNDKWPEVSNYTVDRGRFFSSIDLEQRRKVVVVGPKVVDELGLGPNPVGKEVYVGSVPATVIGVMEKRGVSLGTDVDNLAFIPFDTALSIFGRTAGEQVQLRLQAESTETVDEVRDGIKRLLRQRHHIPDGQPDDFEIMLQDEILKTVGSVLGMVTAVVGGVVGIALLVGGIGIMNIMLVSVTERTREIGVRKALGATRRTVLVQFLLEAMVLCVIGGIIGVAAGYGAATFIGRLNGWPMHVSMDSVLLAVGFSAAIGIFFGVWPARRAARLDPIEALRYE